MTVLVMSIDFDGCLAHQNFIESDSLDMLHFNRPFLHYLQDLKHDYTHHCLMLGSSRQSSFTDFMSQKANRLLLRCFPYYLQIATYMDLDFEPLLMADVYSNLAPGTAYNLELALAYPFKDKTDFSVNYLKLLEFQGNQRQPLAPDAFSDTSKLSLLYAQIHFIAQKYPDQVIRFKFFDDNCAYLTKIYEIFNQCPLLLPRQLSLDLCMYDGQGMQELFHVQGSGNRDEDFYQTLVDLKHFAHVSPWENSKDLALFFNEDLVKGIETRLTEEGENRLRHQKESNLICHLIELYRKAKNLEQRQEIEAAKIAFDLHRELTHLFYQYQEHKLELNQFITDARSKIEATRPCLSQHRGWKEILVNLLAAIMMFAGFGYLLAAAIKGRVLLFKVKTDADQKLENIEQDLFRIQSDV